MLYFCLGLFIGLLMDFSLTITQKKSGIEPSDLLEQDLDDMKHKFGSTLVKRLELWHIQWLVNHAIERIKKEKKESK